MTRRALKSDKAMIKHNLIFQSVKLMLKLQLTFKAEDKKHKLTSNIYVLPQLQFWH